MYLMGWSRSQWQKSGSAEADSSLTTPKLRPKTHKSLFGDPENYVWGTVHSE